MQCKRKSVPEIDENEDGARARIVEELVINFMHTEAVRLQKARSYSDEEPFLFPKDEHFSSDFGSALCHLVRNLEVANCKHWEWEDAAHKGFSIYQDLQKCMEGTLTIDRKNRSIEFTPNLALDLHGVIIRQALDTRNSGNDERDLALLTAAYKATCPQLDFDAVKEQINIHHLENGQHIAQLSGEVRNCARLQKILSVKLTQSQTDQSIMTIATALGDPADFSR